jgi:predicted outer membrane repeat protein
MVTSCQFRNCRPVATITINSTDKLVIRKLLLMSPFLLSVVSLTLFTSTAFAVEYGVNLLQDPGVEDPGNTPSSTGAAVSSIPGWTITGGAISVIPYDSTNFPKAADGPRDLVDTTGGKNFFAGGNAAESSVTQVIDVSDDSSGDIGKGIVVCDLSAWFGGYQTDDDNAKVVLSFLKANNSFSTISSVTLTPVLAADRSNLTGLYYKRLTVAVPAETKFLKAALILTRTTGTYNDGYGDNLSVILRKPMEVSSIADNDTAGTLRYALLRSNNITFAPAVFGAGASQVISLSKALPDIFGDTTITGPGADLLTIERNASASAQFSILRAINYPKFFPAPLSTGPIVNISGLTLTKGVAPSSSDFGGGLLNYFGVATLTQCTVSANTSLKGAGVYSSGSLMLEVCTIAGNTAKGFGGGISSSGQLEIIGCDFDNNSAPQASGGALYSDSTTTASIVSTTFSKNAAELAGGAIDLAGGVLVISNSTFSSNSAGNLGAAINTADSDLFLDACTFFENRQAIAADNSTINVANTLFSRSGTSDFKVTGAGGATITSGGYNLTTDTSDTYLKTEKNDQFVGDAKLGPLQDNGGPTPTHALLPGSPAIDRGNTSQKKDQRGLDRAVDFPGVGGGNGNQSDVGAFEVQPATPTPSPTTTPSPGSTPTPSPGISPTPTPSPGDSPTPTPTPGGTATPTPTPTPPSQLLNLSARKAVGTGSDVTIGGFIVVGTDNKKVLIRGLGPSLPVSGALADPVLELHNAGTTLLANNNNWKDTQQSDIEATSIPPSNDLESAIVFRLPAAAATSGGAGYTAILAGSGGTTGIGLLELYDLDQAANSRLANLSTRGLVSTGDDLLIGGFYPGPLGNASLKVLIRALGPSLSAQGVSGPLSDPLLELHDSNGNIIASNDNWQDTEAADIHATGIPPSDPRESAIVTTLTPAEHGYTAVVRGANGVTGISLVEVYALQ